MAWLCSFLLLFVIQLYVCEAVSYKTLYFKQPVDHFSFTQNNTFQQKYLYADEHWTPGSAIFFYTGNDGAIETFCTNTGLMWELAPEYKALLIFAEHRYYGTSLPFGNKSFTSPEYTGYLSSEQALADFAVLLHHLKTSIKGAENSPVIAFGGSYGGMLAAWIRLKYPHIVAGAIASSAPVNQFSTFCAEYAITVTNAFHSVAYLCEENIEPSWKTIKGAGKTAKMRQWLSKAWKLCKPLKNESDVKKLLQWLKDSYGNFAVMNYPYPTSFMAKLPGYPIKHFCKPLNHTGLVGKTLLRQMFKGLNGTFNYTGKTNCLDYNMFDNSRSKGWDYQSCTEMVMPMCTERALDMFDESPWNFSSWSAGCRKRWGVTPRPDMAVTLYGGRDLRNASNIVFSNGLFDPWSSGSITMNVSDSVIAVKIRKGPHALDLRHSDPRDPPSVKEARNIERQWIWKWIHEHK